MCKLVQQIVIWRPVHIYLSTMWKTSPNSSDSDRWDRYFCEIVSIYFNLTNMTLALPYTWVRLVSVVAAGEEQEPATTLAGWGKGQSPPFRLTLKITYPLFLLIALLLNEILRGQSRRKTLEMVSDYSEIARRQIDWKHKRVSVVSTFFSHHLFGAIVVNAQIKLLGIRVESYLGHREK